VTREPAILFAHAQATETLAVISEAETGQRASDLRRVAVNLGEVAGGIMPVQDRAILHKHLAIERGPSMWRLYQFRCEHCLAWSEELKSFPCCDSCGEMVCKNCITPISWREPDEGDWGGGECKRCARFTECTRPPKQHLVRESQGSIHYELGVCVGLTFSLFDSAFVECDGLIEPMFIDVEIGARI
jgi:hypothetical protein